MQDRIVEINRAAAAVARRSADRFTRDTGQPRFVAGSIGPSGLLPSTNDPTLSNISFQELVDVFREQSVGLIQGGADLLLIETQQDILETKAAVHGAWRAFGETGIRLPLQVQATLDTSGRMLLGTDIAAALTTLECLPVVDVIGLNCSTGPDYMREPVRYLCAHSRKPIAVIPNAGLPLNVDGVAVYPLKPVPLSETLAEFVTELGVNAVETSVAINACVAAYALRLELESRRCRVLFGTYDLASRYVHLALTPEGRKAPSGIGLFPAPASDREVRRVALAVAGSATVAALLRTGKGAHRR